MKIGFVGLGNMGSEMAGNLLRAGHQVTVYNRTRSRAEALVALGAKLADTPADTASGDAIITMLADDHAVESVILGRNGTLQAMAPECAHISMSTISVSMSERLTDAHQKQKRAFIAAPVFGRPEAAKAAKLFIVAAGPAEVVDKCKPVFDAVGQRTFHVGERPSQANIIKLCGNFMIVSMIETLGEAFALVRKHNVDPHAFLEVLTNSLFAAPAYRTYGEKIAANSYEPVGFRLALGLKDVRLVLEAADTSAVPMPVASLVRDRFVSGVAKGLSDADWSSIAHLVAADAGLDKR